MPRRFDNRLQVTSGAAALGVISDTFYDRVGGSVVLVIRLGGMLGLLVGFVAYGTLAFMLVMHIPFGADAMLVSFFAQTTAEPTPTGSTNVYHVMPDDNQPNKDDAQTKKKAAFRHSQIYDHPEVIAFIGNWIDKNLKTNSGK